MNLEAATQTLSQAIQDGIVYNADFTYIKLELSNLYDRDERALRDLLCNSGDGAAYKPRTHHAKYPGISDLYDVVPYHLAHIAGAQKKYQKIRATCPENVQEAADAFFAKWVPVKGLIDQAKPLIVKTRKPSSDPNKTPARTLENTGTCPVCGQNVKLDAAGNLVRHGYTVEYSRFEGDCFGVGYKPFEVSKQGAVDFRDMLKRMRDHVASNLEKIEMNPECTILWNRRSYEPGDVHYLLARDNSIGDLRSRIRQAESSIKCMDERIQNWCPKVLPGVKAGFGR